MSTQFQYKVFPDIPRAHIISMWNSFVDQSILNDEDHSGKIKELGTGIYFKDEKFDSREDANKWLFENHSLWTKAWAVTFTEDEEVKYMVGGNCSY